MPGSEEGSHVGAVRRGIKALQWLSTGNNFILKGHLAMSADIFDWHNLGKRVQFESAGQMSGVFASIL